MFQEITLATTAVCDTANEINDVVKNLKRCGIIKDIAGKQQTPDGTKRDTLQILQFVPKRRLFLNSKTS
ncbi:MAG: hypothetical protein WA323_02645 [Candidatus Nitrosopolaris sp.]|jgi:hypothetical protein